MTKRNVRLAILQLLLLQAAAFAMGFYFDRYLHRAIVVKMDVVCHVPSVNTAPANVTRL